MSLFGFYKQNVELSYFSSISFKFLFHMVWNNKWRCRKQSYLLNKSSNTFDVISLSNVINMMSPLIVSPIVGVNTIRVTCFRTFSFCRRRSQCHHYILRGHDRCVTRCGTHTCPHEEGFRWITLSVSVPTPLCLSLLQRFGQKNRHFTSIKGCNECVLKLQYTL